MAARPPHAQPSPAQIDRLIDTSKGQFALLDALNYLSDQPKSLYRHNGALPCAGLGSDLVGARAAGLCGAAPLGGAPRPPGRLGPPPRGSRSRAPRCPCPATALLLHFCTLAVLNLGYIRTKLPAGPGQVTEEQWRLADPEEVASCHSDLLLNETDRVVMVSWQLGCIVGAFMCRQRAAMQRRQGGRRR